MTITFYTVTLSKWFTETKFHLIKSVRDKGKVKYYFEAPNNKSIDLEVNSLAKAQVKLKYMLKQSGKMGQGTA
jgi:hypothetical protein